MSTNTPFARIAALPGYRTWTAAGTVAWMPRGRFALALGDPAGPAPLRARAARAFGAAARGQGLDPILVPVAWPAAYREAGYRLLPIGLTARLDLGTFSLSGRPRHSVRHGVNRARRAGLTCEITSGSAQALLPELAAVSAEWLRGRRLPERRFGTGWFHPALVAGGRVAVVRDAGGAVQAFATLIEGYRPGEAAVDLLRHCPGAPAGAMDLLLSQTAIRLREEGLRVLDLGLCPLAGCGEGALGRMLHWVYRHGKPWYDFQGLHAFKAKFGPRWERRYLAYRSRRSLLAALVALAELDRPPHIGRGITRPPEHRAGSTAAFGQMLFSRFHAQRLQANHK